MKVAVYYKNDDVRIEDHPCPDIRQGEILVKMKASGICGTDVMEWYRIKKAPRILGHEMAGVIAETGKGVERFTKGDRVFVSHHVPCYDCYHCDKGNLTACDTLHKGNYDPGGFSEFVRVPELNVRHGTFILPDTITFEEATMIEPLACVIAGQRQSNIREGQVVLIIGSGISGLLHIRLAKMKGAKVIATDIDTYRIKKAEEFGADHVMDAGVYSAEKLRSMNDHKLADVVVVCAGARQAIYDAISSIDRKGTVLFFAVPETGIEFPAMQFWRDEITMTFSYGASNKDLEEAIRLIEGGNITIRDMITDRIPLSDIQQGFKLVSNARESLKVVVVPDEDA
jgi:L-iditol 2-dehydrogenase